MYVVQDCQCHSSGSSGLALTKGSVPSFLALSLSQDTNPQHPNRRWAKTLKMFGVRCRGTKLARLIITCRFVAVLQVYHGSNFRPKWKAPKLPLSHDAGRSPSTSRQAGHCHQDESPVNTLWVNEATRTIVPCHRRFTRSYCLRERSRVAHQVANDGLSTTGDPRSLGERRTTDWTGGTRGVCVHHVFAINS